MKSCPPCTGDCQQGRGCPRPPPVRHRPLIIGLLLIAPLWALLAWFIFSGANP